jgi:hypothetical protein
VLDRRLVKDREPVNESERDPFEIDTVNDNDVDTECDAVSVLLALSEFVKVMLLVDDIELDRIDSLNESLVETDCEWDLREAVRVPAAHTEGSGHHAMAHIIMTISILTAAHDVDNDRCIVVWKNDWSTNSTKSLPLRRDRPNAKRENRSYFERTCSSAAKKRFASVHETKDRGFLPKSTKHTSVVASQLFDVGVLRKTNPTIGGAVPPST